MGEESGGGPSGSETRGQVGLTKAEQNRRAAAQEPMRGGARAAASRNAAAISEAEISRQEAGDFSGGDSITTSTEGAFRDLAYRASEGQIPQKVQDLPSVVGMAARGLNRFGADRAKDIQAKISAGGTPVYDSVGRIQGVVSQQQLGDFRGDVYTGAAQYNPIGTGVRAQRGRGYVMSASDVQAAQTIAGGNDGGAPTTTAATATNVTGSTTTLSNAARRQQIGAAAGGASRRTFI